MGETTIVIIVLLLVGLTGIANGSSGFKWIKRDEERSVKVAQKAKAIDEEMAGERKKVLDSIDRLRQSRLDAKRRDLGDFADMYSRIENADPLAGVDPGRDVPEEPFKENLKAFDGVKKGGISTKAAAIISAALGVIFAVLVYNLVLRLGSTGAFEASGRTAFLRLSEVLQANGDETLAGKVILAEVVICPALFLVGTVFSVMAHKNTDRVERAIKAADSYEAEAAAEKERFVDIADTASAVTEFTDALAAAQRILNEEMSGLFGEEENADWVSLDVTNRKAVFAALGCAQVLDKFTDTRAMEENGELTDEMEKLMDDREIRNLAKSALIQQNL